MWIWWQFGSKLKRGSRGSPSPGRNRFAQRKRKRSGRSLSPVLLSATYTMLNGVGSSVTLYTMSNFCFAAKSAPSSSWALYLCFPLVQLSKHTEYLLYSRHDWKALVPWFISICYGIFLFILFCFAVKKLESLYFQSAKQGEQEAILLKTQTPIIFLKHIK